MKVNSVHIVAEIWSASFYRTAVNGPTMSESVPRASAQVVQIQRLIESLYFVFGLHRRDIVNLLRIEV